MKKFFIITNFIIPLTILSCTAIAYSPGTLGAIAICELNCSESELHFELSKIIENENFKLSIADTNIISWWQREGYDFLNYKCLNINKTLYMITIDSENSVTSEISIRSFYDRSKKEWMFAKEFNSHEEYNAKKAMDYLLKNISTCDVR